jgi:site-specific DNA recombinase
MLTFAQFERELISERTKDKLLERAQKGMWNGGGIPFGYKVVDKQLVPDEQKAQKLTEIFALFSETGSLAKTYQILKAKKAFNDKGQPFSKTHLQHVLRNITYTGKLRYAGKIYQGLHQPLISDYLFNSVQTLFHETQQKQSVYKNRLLAGLVRCAECDSIMTPTHTKKKPRQRYYYYRCTKTYRQDWNACATQQVNADRLEQLIIENLKRVSLDNNYIDSLIFKLNFNGLGAQQELEPSPSRSEIDPKSVQKNLKDLVDYLEKASKIEQTLAIKKYHCCPLKIL